MFVDANPVSETAHLFLFIKNTLSKANLRIKVVERPGATLKYFWSGIPIPLKSHPNGVQLRCT